MKDYLIISNIGHRYIIKDVIKFKEEDFSLHLYTEDKVHVFNNSLIFKIEFDTKEKEKV